ncbi:hypothetical protein CsSME_00010582 [Camellia sinensis var. sinensis]
MGSHAYLVLSPHFSSHTQTLKLSLYCSVCHHSSESFKSISSETTPESCCFVTSSLLSNDVRKLCCGKDCHCAQWSAGYSSHKLTLTPDSLTAELLTNLIRISDAFVRGTMDMPNCMA